MLADFAGKDTQREYITLAVSSIVPHWADVSVNHPNLGVVGSRVCKHMILVCTVYFLVCKHYINYWHRQFLSTNPVSFCVSALVTAIYLTGPVFHIFM